MSDSIARVENVTKHYLLGQTTVHALRGVSLLVQTGEFLAISGPSGSGKTTLLNIIGCIENPTSGGVFIENVDAGTLSKNELADLRAAKISFVFQNFNLLPVLTAFENVEFPLLAKKIGEDERKSRVEKALEQVGLAKHGHHKPMELSGGQRQRVAIARAIVGNPLMILADEPTANLDQKTGVEILDLMKSINVEQKTTFVFSTHDKKVMDRASRIEYLSDGLFTNAR